MQFDLFPTVNFNTEGYTRFGDDIASDNYFHTFTAMDTMTLIRGNHTLKIGGEVQRHRDNYRNFGNGGGTFNFTRLTTGLPGNNNTGDAFASFLLGETQSGTAYFRDSIPGARYTVFGAFVDDTWKVTNKLTLTMGFRWEPVVPHSDPANRISYMDITAPNAAAGNLPGAIHYGGSPDNGNRFLNILWTNFAPRVGIAYRVTNRTVVRGGCRHLQLELHQSRVGLACFRLLNYGVVLLGRLRNHSRVQLGWRIPAELPPSARHRSDRSESPGRHRRFAGPISAAV